MPALTRWTAAALVAVGLAGCGIDDSTRHDAEILTGGNVEKGKALIIAYGCRSCHTIPGIPGANATVGPPLNAMARRAYIGGVLANSADNMVRWLMDPQAIDSLSAMPKLGLDERGARNVAAYIFTLR